MESFKFAILTEHDRNPHHTPQYVLDRILPLALYPLLFVCRSFNYEVSRLLYSAVRVQFVAESNSKAWDTGPNWNLLQTLGSSPHLTKHVHHFCIRFLDPEYTEDPVLPLTDLNDHLRDQNITEVQSLIQKAMGNMSHLTSLAFTLPNGPLLLHLSHFVREPPFQLVSADFNYGDETDPYIWDFISAHPSITSFVYRHVSIFAQPRVPESTHLLPNVVSLTVTSSIAWSLLATGERPSLGRLNLSLDQPWYNPDPAAWRNTQSITELHVASHGGPPAIALGYVSIFPNVTTLFLQLYWTPELVSLASSKPFLFCFLT